MAIAYFQHPTYSARIVAGTRGERAVTYLERVGRSKNWLVSK